MSSAPSTGQVPHALLERALGVVSESVLVTDARRAEHPIVWVSGAFEGLTGYAPEEVVGRNCRFLQGPETDPDSVRRLRDAVRDGRPERVVLLNYRKDGTRFFNEVTLEPVHDEDGEVTHFIGVQHDVTDRVQHEALWAAGRGVHDVLTAWHEQEEGLGTLTERLGVALGWEAGGLWAREPGTGGLVCRGFWARPDEDLAAFGEQMRAVRTRPGTGLVGRAWQLGTLVVAEDDAQRTSAVPRLLEAAGLHSAMALPAVHDGEVLAVLALWAREPRQVDAQARTALGLLGDALGDFLRRHRSALQPGPLSPREVEVLQLAAQGQGVVEIAEALVISTGTVRTHFKNIYDRLGVRDRAAAVAVAMRLGVVR